MDSVLASAAVSFRRKNETAALLFVFHIFTVIGRNASLQGSWMEGASLRGGLQVEAWAFFTLSEVEGQALEKRPVERRASAQGFQLTP